MPQNQLVSNGGEHHADSGKSNGGQSHLFVSALQEIGRRCGSKVHIFITARAIAYSHSLECEELINDFFTGGV